MTTLSAVVITKDEGARLAGCLASLRGHVDEIVVVDDASTDDTVAVARGFTPHVHVHPHEGENWDLNKNVGMDRATGEWVLLIDADERLTPEGAAAIRALLAGTPACAAYWLPRREWYFGHWARHAARGAEVLRLVKRGAACFEGDRLHAHPRVEGAIGRLDAPLDHLAYASVAAYVAKTNAYTDHEAAVRFAAGERAGVRELVVVPLKQFRYRYWRCQGYKDGVPGLVYCLATALYPLLQAMKLWELAQRARAGEAGEAVRPEGTPS